ncbi:hypothetical protein PILCRDRAFT_88175 [Piloderma croceum F 1598]|uniref:Uncharacterized protein n=1 Tax=Piloderma croceum (strain F 1598) TaxID=765440 RepID=A0A0C3C175_PILCF|nr:hypothetical protein PILCRDRAFT_88175 [Piloderma croceum F 1598]
MTVTHYMWMYNYEQMKGWSRIGQCSEDSSKIYSINGKIWGIHYVDSKPIGVGDERSREEVEGHDWQDEEKKHGGAEKQKISVLNSPTGRSNIGLMINLVDASHSSEDA